MTLLTPEFFKVCGIEPVTENSFSIKYFIDNKLSIVWFKSNMEIVYLYHLSESSVNLMIKSTDYTINEFKHLCMGLRINLQKSETLKEGQTPGYYGC